MSDRDRAETQTSGRSSRGHLGRIAAPRSILALGLLASVTGCIPGYRVIPADGSEVAHVVQSNITLVADADAWDGSPGDLSEYVTPVWVEVIDGSDEDLAVTYADFSLTDESGFRYAAINPYTQRPVRPQATPPERPAPKPQSELQERPRQTPERHALAPLGSSPSSAQPSRARPVLVAYREGAGLSGQLLLAQHHVHRYRRPGRRHPGWRPGRVYPRARTSRGRTGAARVYRYRSPRYGVRGRGFYVYPRYRSYFYYRTWPGYSFYPPYYSGYVYYWGPRYYPSSPPRDVLRLGLPEGVVASGGRVSGFIYFQNALSHAHQLKLTWHARTPSKRPVATLSTAFVVVE